MQMIDLDMAQSLCAKAIELAYAAYGRPVCVSVCDVNGFLVAFARGDGAPVRSIEIAQGKAYSAARMGVNTSAFLKRVHREQIETSYFCDPRLTALPGGAVLKAADGSILGGAGISGLTSEQDQLIADRLAASVAEGDMRSVKIGWQDDGSRHTG